MLVNGVSFCGGINSETIQPSWALPQATHPPLEHALVNTSSQALGFGPHMLNIQDRKRHFACLLVGHLQPIPQTAGSTALFSVPA